MEQSIASLARAQIAIVEQLRIANRIALASSDLINRSDPAFSHLNIVENIVPTFAVTSNIPDDVANLLGLDDTGEDADASKKNINDMDNGVS